jgi:hypothetical protein
MYPDGTFEVGPLLEGKPTYIGYLLPALTPPSP